MKSHTYRTSMRLPHVINDVFPFFCDVRNLQRITPPELHFDIVTNQPIEIVQGTQVDYRLRLYGIQLKWRSQITVWDPPYKFVDEQVHGPFTLWIHTHRFCDDNGSTIIEDNVEYRLPLWPLGDIVFPLIKWQIGRIFSYRQCMIRKLLTGKST